MKQVLKSQCQNCLMTGARIVSPEAADQILKTCLDNNKYFICHRSTMGDLGKGKTEVMCKGFYDAYPHLYQILDQIGLIEWIELPPGKKLPTWKEMNK